MTIRRIHPSSIAAPNVTDGSILLYNAANSVVEFGTAPSANNAIALNQAGELVITTGTVRWYAPSALTINSIVARLGTAADATVTAVAKKNGSTVATISITAGQSEATNNVGFSMVTGDYLTLDITAIGSTNKGADLNVQFLYAFN